MADQTATDKGVMEQTAKNFEAVGTDLNSSLTTLKQKVADLQAAWVGQGGTSFQNTMLAWSDRQTRINELLHQTAGLIRSAGQSYTTVDDNAASRSNNVALPTLPL
jgi:WXG100 family type VII secretion target